MAAGPTPPATPTARRARPARRPNGTWLIVDGDGTTNTSIRDPVANTMIAGPALSGAVDGGGAIKRLPTASTSSFRPTTPRGRASTCVANTAVVGPVLTGNADEAALRRGPTAST
jgi:hypothetical protein